MLKNGAKSFENAPQNRYPEKVRSGEATGVRSTCFLGAFVQIYVEKGWILDDFLKILGRFVHRFWHRFSNKFASPFFDFFIETPNPTNPHTHKPTNIKAWPGGMRACAIRRPLPAGVHGVLDRQSQLLSHSAKSWISES